MHDGLAVLFINRSGERNIHRTGFHAILRVAAIRYAVVTHQRFETLVADSGEEGIRQAQSARPDCILMDAWWADRRDELRQRPVELRLVVDREEGRHDRYRRDDRRQR